MDTGIITTPTGDPVATSFTELLQRWHRFQWSSLEERIRRMVNSSAVACDITCTIDPVGLTDAINWATGLSGERDQ